ncbi:hypothetical protein [Cryptosporangium aurantiacum]|uniref:Uncharacterized protein n=1 Tax=Cryptosporangium aurantiacum TaxID=134849 RepID=A0A1M7PUH4_9ACTN|nr:hypothetical protein [Cryptosporangium aurantiacum]SHN21191.1 hypothetical protein SAMN05443668_103713 [Cryptosporangium aurantiacum]
MAQATTDDEVDSGLNGSEVPAAAVAQPPPDTPAAASPEPAASPGLAASPEPAVPAAPAAPVASVAPAGAPAEPVALTAPAGAPAEPVALTAPAGAPAEPVALTAPAGAPAVPAVPAALAVPAASAAHAEPAAVAALAVPAASAAPAESAAVAAPEAAPAEPVAAVAGPHVSASTAACAVPATSAGPAAPAPVAAPAESVAPVAAVGSVAPAAAAAPAAGGARPGTLIIERILRDREGVWREILAEQQLNAMLRRMLISSVVSLAVYGLVLGASAGPLQALSSAVKLPLLFLLTLGICLPTLYLFNLVFGARLSIRQALALVLVSITVTGALTLAFAPISLFFLVTANDYAFFKLLNVLILMLTGFVGLSVMVDGMRGLNRLSGHEPQERPRPLAPYGWPPPMPAPGHPGASGHPGHPGHGGHSVHPAQPALEAQATRDPQAALKTPVPGAFDRPVNTRLLYVWVLLFGFVGTQLAWTLRPFIGEPSHPFQLFRDLEGSFYANVLDTLAQIF